MRELARLRSLNRIAALAEAFVHCFAWDDWKADGSDHMKSPGGRRLSNATFQKLSGKTGAKAPASAPQASPAPDLNTHLARNVPTGVDTRTWKRLLIAPGVRAIARAYVEHEGKPKGSDWEYDHAGYRRQIEWRLKERKLPPDLVDAAIQMARLESAHRAATGTANAYDPPQPARAGRYISDAEFNTARYAGVNGPLVRGPAAEYSRLLDGLRDRVKKLANGAHFDAQSVGSGDPWRDGTDWFLGATGKSLYGASDWNDRKNWTPANLKAEWAKSVEPYLARGRELLAVLRDDSTFSAKTDPEELVRRARATDNFYVSELYGKVLNRIHKIDFRRHSSDDSGVPSWGDIASGKSNLGDVRRVRAEEAAAYKALSDGYARTAVSVIKAAVKLFDAKKSEHWPYLQSLLRKSDLGKIQRGATWDYSTGKGVRVEEFRFWPKGGRGITARTVPALLNKLRVIALSLNERTATSEQLDKLARG